MSTRRLVVLRHAKAEAYEGRRDIERSLTGRGRRDAAAAGAWLRDAGLVPEAVVCSPAVRTRETWDVVRAALDGAPEARYDERVYDASVTDLLDVVAQLPADASTVLLVGHNPGCEELVHALTGTPVGMATSAVAVLAWPGGVSTAWEAAAAGGAALEHAQTPRG